MIANHIELFRKWADRSRRLSDCLFTWRVQLIYRSCFTLRASVKRNRNIMPKDTSSHYFCGHCKDYVGKSTFYKHKKRYYNHSARAWRFAESAKSQPAKTSGASTFMDPDDISFDDEECLSMSQGMPAFCIMGLTFRS